MTASRVRLIVNDLQPYGAQRVAMTLAAGLRDRGRAPELVLWDEAPGEGEQWWAGIPVRRLAREPRGAVGFARQSVALARLLHRDPTPVLGVLTYSNLLALNAAAIARSRTNVVVSEHNLTSVAMAGNDRRARVKFSLMRRAYPRAAGIVAVSNDVAEDLSRLLRITESDVTTVLNPVDLGRVRAAAQAPVIHPWLVDPRRTTLVCVGALRPAKGQARLLLALRHLPAVSAIFIGDGTELVALQRASRDLEVADRVEFVGWQDNPYSWMRSADAVVIPSRWEGFGLVAVEAAATGTRLVGSDCGGLGEVLRELGAPAVPQASPREDAQHAQDLAAQITTALASPTPTYRLGAFDPAQAVTRYSELLGV